MKECKNCHSPLEVRQTKKSPAQLQKAYYYSAYYYCNKCHKLYHDDTFKVVNPQTPTLDFTQKTKTKSAALQPRESQHGRMKDADVEIWTDGACTRNGTPQAKAAWAFVSGETERAGLVEGKQTNNIAEGLAILYALVWAAEEGHKRIKLHTDSQISLFNLNKSPEKVKANTEIFRDIAEVITNNRLVVEYIKVLGHSGDTNNDRADRLANGLATQ